MPSHPPKGWFETIMNGPFSGIFDRSSVRMSVDIRKAFMAAAVNSVPDYFEKDGYIRLILFSPDTDMIREAAREPAGPLMPIAFRISDLLITFVAAESLGLCIVLGLNFCANI